MAGSKFPSSVPYQVQTLGLSLPVLSGLGDHLEGRNDVGVDGPANLGYRLPLVDPRRMPATHLLASNQGLGTHGCHMTASHSGLGVQALQRVPVVT